MSEDYEKVMPIDQARRIVAQGHQGDRVLRMMGWTGGILLAMCGLPEALATIARGYCVLSWPFLFMWGFGEVFCFIPILLRIKSSWLLLNYGANIIFVAIMIYYKAFPVG